MNDQSTDTNTVERVARAIYEGRNGTGVAPWRRRDKAHKAPYLSDAHAAIAAMRSASVAPICQVVIERHPVMMGGENIMREIWQAMIDVALSEQTKG